MKLVDATYDADEWVLVPKEPTENMYEHIACGIEHQLINAIAAAPIHPSIRDHVGNRNDMVWISCDERLPEDCKNYLCFFQRENRTFYIGELHLNPVKNGFYVTCSEEDDAPIEFVTHWMPLLLPPEKP